ncbi:MULTISPECIES: tyrosine-type recombinase/integrase [Burkholderia cepacia complex]|jgi:integrase|uniref:Integrase family protein n=1 Tax=Burkholderia vietnamiensis TaxID=60552 RepID=A0AAW7T5L9_BURVI|nr:MULTISPECIES: integrase family protein [Burkholderia cepacia complex]MDN7797189.1 integrase family protein [Burkholderia vietnamiensis]
MNDRVSDWGMIVKINFTAGRVEAHKCPPGKDQAFLWDSRSPGLGLRVTKSGAKAYVFQGKLHKETIRITIGDPRSWTIDRAQEEARRLQTLLDGGIDPREHAAEQKAAREARKAEARRRDVSVAEAWSEYVEYLRTRTAARSKQLRSDRYIEEHLMYASPGGVAKKRGSGKTKPGALWPLMSLGLGQLNRGRVAEWLENESKDRPTAAAYGYRMLRAFVRWCDSTDDYRGIVSAEVYAAKSVADAVPRVGERRDRLERSQLSAWFMAVRRLPIVPSVYLQGLLLNGPRRGELEALRWEDVDFRWGSLRLKDKIDAEGRVIPLTPYFSSLLRELKRANEQPPTGRQRRALAAQDKEWAPSAWVFPSATSASGHIAEPRSAHSRALAEAGLPHITIHGLRRSFTSLAKAKWLDAPAGVVAQIQGHKPSAVQERHYTYRTLDELREWHDKIEGWMLEQAGIDRW